MDTLMELKQSLLNWYEFRPDASVLVLGDESGAITSLLKRRVENVCTDAEVPGMYDYVIVLNLLETAADPVDAIKGWAARLNEGGTLLLSCGNRYGLKYFCGTRDPYTGVVFDGVNGYLEGSTSGRLYSSEEIKDFIASALDMHAKFYYPVPDADMPQMIFTDDYHNGINAAERLVDYNYRDPSMIGVEHRMLAEAITSGALPFNSNSFLIEISAGEVSDITYAVTTTDRGVEKGCATTIRRDGLVYKRPLYDEGVENLRGLVANTDYLLSKGVPVLPLELKNDEYGVYVQMEQVKAPGLTTVLDDIAAGSSEALTDIFDELYSYICAACDSKEDSPLGPVQNIAYLDIAPCNCFYVNGKLLLYDQEFTKKDCPSLFAMYRTIKYCYASDRKLDGLYSIKKMYERYGITDALIDEFEKMETEFINSIRHKDDNSQLFAWATPDYKFMYTQMNKVSEVLPDGSKPYKVGYVPGVYDLFHKGHLRLFERCKERCDYLIVGVLTDELVEFYKGKKPIISYEDRAEVICGLSCVDEVVPVDFTNTDKLDAWEQLHYDCHFSGNDHINHWNDVWEELKKRGSNMEFFSYTEGISSTSIKKKMGGKE